MRGKEAMAEAIERMVEGEQRGRLEMEEVCVLLSLGTHATGRGYKVASNTSIGSATQLRRKS